LELQTFNQLTINVYREGVVHVSVDQSGPPADPGRLALARSFLLVRMERGDINLTQGDPIMVRSLIPWKPELPQMMEKFRREMDSLFDRFFEFGGNGRNPWLPETSLWSYEPCVDVAETDEGYEVIAELPGLSRDEFSVELKDNDLWITGEKKEETESEGRTFLQVGRRYGVFRQVVALPHQVDADRVNAEFKDGILTIHVPKTEEAKPHRITVAAAS
jgi:HSP20 family protein